jgi:hypothetical protein
MARFDRLLPGHQDRQLAPTRVSSAFPSIPYVFGVSIPIYFGSAFK